MDESVEYGYGSMRTDLPDTAGVDTKRKRSYDDPVDEDGGDSPREAKRSHHFEKEDSHGGSHGFSDTTPSLKVIIPNYAAGALIGKGGANIKELESQYGAKLRLSPSGEFYPGTDERVVIINGEVNQIVDLHNYLMDKIHTDSQEAPPGRFRDEERGQQVKIIVPNATAGLVIGRGGATIKALQDETKAKIMITGRDGAKVPGERIITISGNTEQRLEATRHVIAKIAADPENMLNKNLTYAGAGGAAVSGHGGHSGHGKSGGGKNSNGNAFATALTNSAYSLNPQDMFKSAAAGNSSALSSFMAAMQGNMSQPPPPPPTQSSFGGGGFAGMAANVGMGGTSFPGGIGSSSGIMSSIKTTVSICMEIPDILAGAILGKGGKTVSEFIQFSGAKIQFSPKNEFAPGTTDRVLTIQGDLNQTQIAYFLINQKIIQAENELSQASAYQKR